MEGWGHLPVLSVLNLESNQLTGTVPLTWKGIGGLQHINLCDNELELEDATPETESNVGVDLWLGI